MEFKESKRDAMYRSMKYWGKKPHNIWSDLIKQNTKKNDIVMDPFAGSGVAFFESIALHRKPVVNDINPLTHFIVDVFSSSYNEKEINKLLKYISINVQDNALYKNYMKTKCSNCGHLTDIYNYRYENNIVAYAYKCENCKKTLIDDNQKDIQVINYPLIGIPEFNLSKLHSITNSSIDKFGGDDFKYLWTPLNSQLLKSIFEIILTFEEPYRKLFVFAFIQTSHLTSKMCAIRGEKSNRILSSSWGRPAFMALSKYMSQNPLIQLNRALYGNSGIVKAISAKNQRNISYNFSSNKEDFNKKKEALVQNIDSSKFSYDRVDFIITDPPYGDIIKYGELSLIWNLWLVKAYPSYKINLDNEIIIDKNKNRYYYEQKMNKVFTNCERSLKDNGKMIFTYNSQNNNDWSSIKNVIKSTNFEISNFYLQNNLRSSESNVKGTTPTSKSDYYIELSKEKNLFTDYNFEILDELINK